MKHHSLLTGVLLATSCLLSASQKVTNDGFALGKLVAIHEPSLHKNHDFKKLKALDKNRDFTKLKHIPSWDFGYGAPMWLTKPGAKVIVPRSDGTFTYGVVAHFARPVITVIVGKNANGTYQTKDFLVTKLDALKWVHKSWLKEARKNTLINKETAFVNYDKKIKNFVENFVV